MCFTPAGNCLRMVSCPAWDGCVSYRQETICIWFPVRLGTAVFHTDRKLFAYGFLSGLALLRFISTGNYLRMVSCPAWDRCVSYRQETICVWFPVRLGADVFHDDRELFAYGFLSDLALLCFIPTGTGLRRVSYSAWDGCVSYRQETIRVWFPVRHDTDVLHTGRKLFAYGFLLDMASLCFMTTGNYLRMISYPAWHCCVSYRQETVCVWFPIQLGADVFHTDRKLFAYGFLFGLRQMCFISVGNYLRMVSCPAWDGCVSYRQETVCVWFPIRLGTDVFRIDRKLPGEEISGLRFAALEMTGQRYTMVFHAHRKLSHYLTSPLPPTQTVRPAGFCFSLLLW